MVSFIHVDDTMQCGKKEAISKFNKAKVKEQFRTIEKASWNLVLLEDRPGRRNVC